MIPLSEVTSDNWSHWKAAYHEAGHAIATFECEIDSVLGIWATATGEGCTEQDHDVFECADPALRLRTLLGGPAADAVFKASFPEKKYAALGMVRISVTPCDENGMSMDDAAQIERCVSHCEEGDYKVSVDAVYRLFNKRSVLHGLDALARAVKENRYVQGIEAKRIYAANKK